MSIYFKHEHFNPDLFSVGDTVLVAGLMLELRHDQCHYFLLSNTGSGATVFYALGISDKEAFCAMHYGYSLVADCDFPRTKTNDWPGIGRLAAALMQRSEEMGFPRGRKLFNSAEKLKQYRPKYKDWIALGAFGVYFVDVDPESKGFFLNSKNNDFCAMLKELNLSPADFFSQYDESKNKPRRTPLTNPGDYDALNQGIAAMFDEFVKRGLIKR